MGRTRRAAAAIAAAALLGFAPAAHAAHRNALWRVVHDVCVPLKRVAGVSTPCLSVDLDAHVAVTPNPRSPTEVLLVPTRRVTGIEDPAVLRPGAAQYWAAAWAAQRYVARRAGRASLAPQDVGLAINAIPGRSQDQLHIHVDCVKPYLQQALADAQPRLSAGWRPLEIHGAVWWARRLDGATPAPDPFRLLAADLPGASADMGAWTLVVAGLAADARGPGFALLARRVSPGFSGHGEVLLDKRCAVLAAPAAETDAAAAPLADGAGGGARPLSRR